MMLSGRGIYKNGVCKDGIHKNEACKSVLLTGGHKRIAGFYSFSNILLFMAFLPFSPDIRRT